MNYPFKNFDESTYLKLSKAVEYLFLFLKKFDEAIYFKLNPDVFEAVQNGTFSSGWEHYVIYGFYENRLGVPPELYNAIKDIIAFISPTESVPPVHLRKRVHGYENLLSFEVIGIIVSLNIYSSIKSIIELDGHRCILDFGCGCGRVIKYFHKMCNNSRLYGTDIDNDAILWCQHHLSQIGKFITNEKFPPLPFADEFFDCIYSISVFTHLPEDIQFAWLEELRRVTKRGGYLVLTTHGEELFQTDSEDNKRLFREKGFHYSVGDGTEGLPDFYQTTFHTDDYICNHWSKFYEIKKIIKKGIANHQDLIVCKRPAC